MNNENLKQVKDYDDYQISDQGYILNTKTNNKLCGYTMRGGYIRVKLRKNGASKNFLLHRLMAEHFIPNSQNKPEVNHLGEKDDNRACMLEWATRKENCQHSAKHKTNNYTKKVKQICLKTGEVINEYDKLQDVEKNGFQSRRLSERLKDKTEVIYKNFKWVSDDMYTEKKIKEEKWVYTKDSIYDQINIFYKYQVSNFGRVRGWFGRILVNNKSQGVETIKLTNDNVVKNMKIHRLVIMAFNIPQPSGCTEVDHIDSNHMNNHLNNLRWANRKIQANNIVSKNKLRGKCVIRRKNIKVTYNNECKIYNGLTELSEKINISTTTINKYAKNKKEYFGYTFEFI